MLCEKCKQKEASVVYSEVKGKKKIQHHLCEQCLQSQSEYIEEPSFSYSLQSLIGKFLEAVASQAEREESQIKCEQCGITYNKFRKQGRFGCENDYVVFRESLIKLFQHIHGASRHKGKVPAKFRRIDDSHRRISKLQKLLEQAVKEERYEEAAALRDQIKALENKTSESETLKGERDGHQ